jgi:hypothetical protein
MQIVISFDFVQARIQSPDVGKYLEYKFLRISFHKELNCFLANMEQADAW